MSSVSGDSWLGREIKRDPNSVYCDMNKTTFYCKPLENGKILLRCMIYADPKLSYIPATLINIGLKNCCMVFLNLVQSKSQKLGVEYEHLIKEK